jgi:hypothetical protein
MERKLTFKTQIFYDVGQGMMLYMLLFRVLLLGDGATSTIASALREGGSCPPLCPIMPFGVLGGVLTAKRTFWDAGGGFLTS